MTGDIVGYAASPLRAFGYVSTPRVPFSDRDLSDLLRAARRANGSRGVTGKLVVLEAPDGVARFAQVVEGPAEGLAVAVARIRADPRHGDLRVVVDGPLAARRFAGWDMGYEPVGAAVFETASADLFG